MGYSKSKRVLKRFEQELKWMLAKRTQDFSVEPGKEDWVTSKLREARALLRKQPDLMPDVAAVIEGYEFRVAGSGRITLYWTGRKPTGNATPITPSSPMSQTKPTVVTGVTTLDEAVQAYLDHYVDFEHPLPVMLENHALPDSDVLRVAAWAKQFDPKISVVRHRNNNLFIGIPAPDTPASLVVQP